MSEIILSPKELAERWYPQVKEKTLTQWRYLRKGPDYIKLGRKVGYPIENVVEYERKQLNKRG